MLFKRDWVDHNTYLTPLNMRTLVFSFDKVASFCYHNYDSSSEYLNFWQMSDSLLNSEGISTWICGWKGTFEQPVRKWLSVAMQIACSFT